jgi:C4-dicarboxylate-specific signal transduction histidine kinase
VIERPGHAGAARPVPLLEAVRSALHLLAPELDKRAIAPVLEGVQQVPVSVQAEPVALEQIVHNLLMNALQALDELPAGERQLRLAVERQGEQGVLRVSDNGRGIAPELLARIFEPFFSTREGGLGLGLSLCETLAGAMGGTLAAEPELPRGARFTLRLPLAMQEGRA